MRLMDIKSEINILITSYDGLMGTYLTESLVPIGDKVRAFVA